jgi:hypothetical protein
VTPGAYDFSYTHIIENANNPGFDCIFTENFTLEIVEELTLTDAGECSCNDEDNQRGCLR